MEREWGSGVIVTPVFTTSYLLSFPFMSKQRKWNCAAPSSTVVHLWTGLTQCGPDNNLKMYHPRAALCSTDILFYKHLGSSSSPYQTLSAKGWQQNITVEDGQWEMKLKVTWQNVASCIKELTTQTQKEERWYLHLLNKTGTNHLLNTSQHNNLPLACSTLS